MVMLKLKGLVSQVTSSKEKEAAYKNEIRELKGELNSTRKELNMLKNEYEKMVGQLHTLFSS
jgi:uncharacterized coiled-coil DUF342 family protein